MLKVTLRGLLAHKVRLVATAVAVLLGVAFVTGTNVLAASVNKSFDTIFSDVYKDIDTVVRSSVQIKTPFGPQRARISQDVIPQLERVDGVAAVEGQVEGNLRVIGPDGKPIGTDQGSPTFGLNWLTQPQLNGWIIGEGGPPEASDQIVLDRRTARDGQLLHRRSGAGRRATRCTNLHARRHRDLRRQRRVRPTCRVVRHGDRAGSGGRTGQIRLHQPLGSAGHLTNRVEQSESRPYCHPRRRPSRAHDFIRENQDAFAEFIGLIEQSAADLRLRRVRVLARSSSTTRSPSSSPNAHANWRCCAPSARPVDKSRRPWCSKQLAVGVIASAIGIGLGILIGVGLKTALESLGFGPTSIPTVIRPRDVVVAVAIGTVVTTLSAALPAVRASRVSPMAAMGEVAYERARITWKRVATGVGLLAIGVLMILQALYVWTDNLLLGVGRGAAVAFVAVIVLGPVLARPLSRVLGWPMPRLGRVTGRLAQENALRSPRRTAATSSALMIGVALVGFIAVIAASFQASIANAIDRSVGADVVVNGVGRGGGPGNGLSPSLAHEVARSPVVDVVSSQRADFAEVAGSGQIVLAVDPVTFPQIVHLDVQEGSFAELANGGVAVPRSLADQEGWRLGTRLPAKFLEQNEAVLPVVAIYETDLPLPGAGLFMSIELFDRTFPITEQVDDLIYVKLASGVSGAAGIAALKPIVDRYPTAELQDLEQFKQQRIDQINRFLLVIYALLALALVIAIIGIINTLLLSVHERTRELGLLRAIGMSRRQVGTSICWEAVLIALIGTVTGLVAAVFFGWAVVRALADQGAHVFAVPSITMALIVVLAAVAGLAAALYPARRASRLNILDAIATE